MPGGARPRATVLNTPSAPGPGADAAAGAVEVRAAHIENSGIVRADGQQAPAERSIRSRSGHHPRCRQRDYRRSSDADGDDRRARRNRRAEYDARVDAPARGGGEVLIGGDARGANSGVRNAQHAFVGADVEIRADATDTGDGGKVGSGPTTRPVSTARFRRPAATPPAMAASSRFRARRRSSCAEAST